MTRKRLVGLAVVVVAAAIALGATVLRGGDSGPKLTHKQVVAEADAACAQLATKNLALRPPPRPYDFQGTDFFDGVQANVDDARERLGDLEAPSADAGALGRLTRALELISTKLEQTSAAASVEQDAEVSTLIVEIRKLVRDAVEDERALGACPGRTSTRTSIAAVIKRTRENPLTETGPLVP
jgi:hypothetical protein